MFKSCVLLISIILAANCVLEDENEILDVVTDVKDVLPLTPDQTEVIADTSYTFQEPTFVDVNVIFEEDPEDEDPTFVDKYVIEDSDDKILKASYDNCRRWLGECLDSPISYGNFCLYMGKNRRDRTCVNDVFGLPYFMEGPIDFKRYSELFTAISKNRNVPVKDWAANRASKAKTRTPAEVSAMIWGDYD